VLYKYFPAKHSEGKLVTGHKIIKTAKSCFDE